MQKTVGSVTHVDTEEMLLTYSEEEKQQREMDAANAKLVFTPEFIPFYPAIKHEYDLSDMETILYGFIRFYLANGSGRFYFTNEQLGRLMKTSTVTISKSIKILGEKKLITSSYRIKAGGGKIRFISDVKKTVVPTLRNLMSDIKKLNGNYNKINKNIDTNVSIGETPREKEVYGNMHVQEVLESFNAHMGQIPADRNPRFVANNVRQMIAAFCLRNKEAYKESHKRELTFSYTLDKSWEWFLAKDYSQNVEKLETFKLKLRVFLDLTEKKLKKERREDEQPTNTITKSLGEKVAYRDA